MQVRAEKVSRFIASPVLTRALEHSLKETESFANTVDLLGNTLDCFARQCAHHPLPSVVTSDFFPDCLALVPLTLDKAYQCAEMVGRIGLPKSLNVVWQHAAGAGAATVAKWRSALAG